MRQWWILALWVCSVPMYAAAPVISANAGDPSSVGGVSGNNSSAVVYTPPPLTLDQRMTRLENQVAYFQSINDNVAQLQQRITDLEGQLEELQHQVALLQQGQQATSALAERVMQLETQSRLNRVTAPAVSATGAATANPSANNAYNTAYQLLAKKQYAQATKAFESFVKQYPKGAQTGSAYYWLGELYLAQGQPDKASQKFRIAADTKGNPKAADALLKLGVIFLANGDSAHAKQSFQKVVSTYPNTTAAKLAAQRLKDMSAHP